MGRSLVLVIFILSLVLLAPVSRAAQVESQAPDQVSLNLVKSDYQSVVLELDVPGYEFTFETINGNEYQYLTLPEPSFTSEPGKPQVPMMSALVGIPPDAQIELLILDDETELISGFHLLKPVPSPLPLSDDLEPGEFFFMVDENAYREESLYPEMPVQIAEEAWVRDQRIVRVEFYPFQYRPSLGEILWHKHLRVEIRFLDGLGSAISLPSAVEHGPFESVLKGGLINYESALNWRAGDPPPSQSFQNAATGPQLAGPAYKIVLDQDGIFRLTYSELQAAGMDVANVDPTTFNMTSQGEDVAIHVENLDGNEHNFGPNEAIIFYGEKFYGDRLAALYADEDAQWFKFYLRQYPDGHYETWAPQFNAIMLEKYTDENVYWLSEGGTPGLRMESVDGTPQEAPSPATYRETVREEQSTIWKTTHFTGEDTWFWDSLLVSIGNPTATSTYTTTVSGLASGIYTATLRGEVVGDTYNSDHRTQFFVNSSINPQALIDERWKGKSRYKFEANFPQSQLLNGENQLEFVTNLEPTMYADKIYFDWFEFEFDRQFKAIGDQITFTSGQAGDWKFVINGYTGGVVGDDIGVLNITDPLSPTVIANFSFDSGTVSFETSMDVDTRFVAGDYQFVVADQISYYEPPVFTGGADYIFITHKDFAATILALAEYRESQGFSTVVVDIDDLYNQFNFGIYHPIAIKNYLAYAYENWDLDPSYVMLVGDGHWNFKGYPKYNSPQIFMPPNLVWVDPWQGEVDSANLLATVVGDDPMPDVHIGRLPVNSVTELDAAIDKIIAYEGSAPQTWQGRHLFVTENTPDPAGNFVAYAERIIGEYLEPGYYVERIYQDDYGCTQPPCPEVNHAITTMLNGPGALITNYIGHASLNRWSNESIFVNTDIATLSNADRLPVILSMTCLDGYWIHPGIINQSGQGLMEEMVRASTKGAVSTFSPTGLGVSSGHDYLHSGFYDSLFVHDDWELGSAAYSAKLNLFGSGSNFDLLHTFTIFGDPALRIKKIDRMQGIYLPNVMR